MKDCDVIYVLEKGGIADQGSFQELMARNASFPCHGQGRRLKFWMTQAVLAIDLLCRKYS